MMKEFHLGKEIIQQDPPLYFLWEHPLTVSDFPPSGYMRRVADAMSVPPLD